MNLRLEDRGGKMDMKPNQTKPRRYEPNSVRDYTEEKEFLRNEK